MLLSMRESWADVCNGLLPEGVRIDHRSLEEQGIDRVPTIHEGYASREMEKRGQPSDRMAINREIGASNRDLAEGDAAVDALRAHQSELRRLLRDMADRAAQAFDRMLESIGHGVDPSDAVEAMRDRDGINLMIPRNAKDSDRPVWHAWLYDRHEWAAIPSHVLREAMTKSVEEQMADIERRMKQLRARKQRIVARENAKARKRRTHLIIRLGGILSNEGVLGYDEGVWNDEGNRQRLLDMLKAHAAELRAWASDAGVRLPSAESAGELREQVRDLPQEPQIQEQPGYGYQPGFQQPQQWQQQPWN